MDSEFQELEDTLKALRPAAPDAACMDRLLAAVQGRMPTADVNMERELARLHPSALSDQAAERLLDTVSHVPFPVNEKVVLFPGSAKPAAAKAPGRRSWIAAAAAVAVLGAFSALMVGGPDGKPSSGVVKNVDSTEGTRSVSNPEGFVSASVGSGVQTAKDEGVVWTPDGKPMRMVKVIYMDRVKYLNEKGEVIEVERPRVEYMMMPEKID